MTRPGTTWWLRQLGEGRLLPWAISRADVRRKRAAVTVRRATRPCFEQQHSMAGGRHMPQGRVAGFRGGPRMAQGGRGKSAPVHGRDRKYAGWTALVFRGCHGRHNPRDRTLLDIFATFAARLTAMTRITTCFIATTATGPSTVSRAAGARRPAAGVGAFSATPMATGASTGDMLAVGDAQRRTHHPVPATAAAGSVDATDAAGPTSLEGIGITACMMSDIDNDGDRTCISSGPPTSTAVPQ